MRLLARPLGFWSSIGVQGNQEGAIDQAVVAEYLASHGYLVVTTPSPMRRTPMQADSEVGRAAERQALELGRALVRPPRRRSRQGAMTVRAAPAVLLALLVAGCAPKRSAAPRTAGPAARDSATQDTARASAGPWCQLADSDVEAAIAVVARQRDADEDCEDRHYAVDDIDGDSLDDFAVTFNLEPSSEGADDESYLMVFLSTREGRAPLVVEIDDIGHDYGERYPTSVSIDGRYVVVDFDNYLPGDRDCCPSASSSVRFLVTPDKLVEQARPTPRHQPPDSRSL